MGTRSRIGILNGNDAITSVYCHWDGYPSNNGKLLVENYQTAEKVIELLSFGDMSILGEKIGEKHDFNARVDGICKFYKRDRGESGVDALTYPAAKFETLARESDAEYAYLFKQGEWYVSSVRQNKRLKFERVVDVLAREAQEE